MSIVKKTEVVCPSCGKKYNVSVWSSLNTQLDPGAKQDLLAGKLLAPECPRCKKINALHYPLLYHEMDKHVMVYFVPANEDCSEALRVFSEQKEALRDVASFTFRIVRTPNALREKALIFENNLDDRVVEVLKLIITNQALDENPGFEFDEALFICKGDECFVHMLGERTLTAKTEMGYYNFIKSLMPPFSESDADEMIIDRAWALDVLGKLNLSEAEEEVVETNQDDACAETPDPAPLLCEDSNNALPQEGDSCPQCSSPELTEKVAVKVVSPTRESKRAGKAKGKFNKFAAVILVLSLIITLLGVFSGIQYFDLRDKGNEVEELQEDVESKEGKIEKLEDDLEEAESQCSSYESRFNQLFSDYANLLKEESELKDDLDFYRDYAAIVNDNSKKYHVYGCDDLDTSSFLIYNVAAAEQNGYYECSKCH